MTQSPLCAALVGATFLFAAGCREVPVAQAPAAVHAPGAVCNLSATDQGTVRGVARFSSFPGFTRVEIDMDGLKPGKHGVHVHEHGDCSAAGMGAGGHLNPGGEPHGMAASSHSHMGDLGNLEADQKGEGVRLRSPRG